MRGRALWFSSPGGFREASHSPREARLEEVQQGHLWGGGSSETPPRQAGSTRTVPLRRQEKAPTGRGGQGRGAGRAARALGRKESRSRPEDERCPGCRRPSGRDGGRNQAAGENLRPQFPRSRSGIWGPRGHRGGLSARAPRVQAPRMTGHLWPPREPVCPRKRRPAPDTQRGISRAREPPSVSPSPPGPRGRRSPRSLHSIPAPLPARRPPLTPETWRPRPGQRRSGARGSQLWARSSGTAGGIGDRAGGGGGRAAPPL